MSELRDRGSSFTRLRLLTGGVSQEVRELIRSRSIGCMHAHDAPRFAESSLNRHDCTRAQANLYNRVVRQNRDFNEASS
jgi:hypothetical protein